MRDIYLEFFMNAKYHLTVAERMFKSYSDFEEKSFLVGVINEMAKASSNLIKAYLIYEGKMGRDYKKNLNNFVGLVSPKYLGKPDCDNIIKILEVQKAQRSSPIEFSRKGDIILLISGKYRFLKLSRIGDFLLSLQIAISRFPVLGRQV